MMSNLPEELFLDITRLSSMKARAAVQTCLLSKRWNHLWERLPDLNFDLSEFYSEDLNQYEQRFSRFVSTMLERRKTDTLDKFRLSCFDVCDKQHCSSIERWILYAIQHKVRVVELEVCVWSVRRVLTHKNIPYDSIEELDLRLGDCNSFGIEMLKAQRDYIAPQSVHLPRLLKLQLRGLCMCSRDFFTELISGCPSLEELWLESFNMPRKFSICSQNLQHLTIKECSGIHNLTFEAPKLLSFCFFGSISDFMHVSDQCGDMPSLTHATLALLTDRHNLYSLDETLENLSFIETLELCASKIKVESKSPSYDLTMYNLKKLSICLHGFEYFPCIWKSLLNLEKLTMWTSCQHSYQHYNGILNWDEELQSALMECKTLKTVEVVCSTLDDQKRQLVDDLCQLGDVKIVISNRGCS
ncbi:F-box family protein [Rhynchospora pubera]|uniref:F-box family protein n=1 Tax=Rhynchospora pubera TaxID=906938 RepID=A0AAV8GGD3_9POAL|nr:F-box family protein [Rhynchospora pubera]